MPLLSEFQLVLLWLPKKDDKWWGGFCYPLQKEWLLLINTYSKTPFYYKRSDQSHCKSFLSSVYTYDNTESQILGTKFATSRTSKLNWSVLGGHQSLCRDFSGVITGTFYLKCRHLFLPKHFVQYSSTESPQIARFRAESKNCRATSTVVMYFNDSPYLYMP